MPRFIYVLGPSYCGSTLLSGLLNNVPGVASAGELHWLLDDATRIGVCTRHGPACDFTAKLKRNGLSSENLYRRCAEALGVDVLAATDKSMGHATRFLRPKEADVILMVKRPEALVASYRRHLPKLTFRGALELYAATYENMQLFVRNGFFHRTAIVDYDSLASNPLATLQHLSARLELPSPLTAVFPPADWHNIGGNVTSYMDRRYATHPVVRDDRWQSELTSYERQLVQQDARAGSVYQQLHQQA